MRASSMIQAVGFAGVATSLAAQGSHALIALTPVASSSTATSLAAASAVTVGYLLPPAQMLLAGLNTVQSVGDGVRTYQSHRRISAASEPCPELSQERLQSMQAEFKARRSLYAQRSAARAAKAGGLATLVAGGASINPIALGVGLGAIGVGIGIEIRAGLYLKHRYAFDKAYVHHFKTEHVQALEDKINNAEHALIQLKAFKVWYTLIEKYPNQSRNILREKFLKIIDAAYARSDQCTLRALWSQMPLESKKLLFDTLHDCYHSNTFTMQKNIANWLINFSLQRRWALPVNDVVIMQHAIQGLEQLGCTEALLKLWKPMLKYAQRDVDNDLDIENPSGIDSVVRYVTQHQNEPLAQKIVKQFFEALPSLIMKDCKFQIRSIRLAGHQVLADKLRLDTAEATHELHNMNQRVEHNIDH